MTGAALRAALALMLAVGLICVVPATQAPAQGQPQDQSKAKTEVGIVFEMPDPRYTDEFKDEAIPALREAVAATIASALDDKIRFLDFSTNAEAAYILTVRLDRAEGSRADGPADFGFHLVLSGPEVRDDARGYVVFRTKDQYLSPIGDQASLAREIEEAIKRADNKELVSQVLRRVSITADADLNSEPLGWIIYRDRTALCIDKDSRIEVMNTFPSFGGTLRAAFEATVLPIKRPDGGIVSLADTSVRPELIKQFKAVDPGEVQVEHFFVVDYRRFCPTQSVPADQVDFSTAGARQ